MNSLPQLPPFPTDLKVRKVIELLAWNLFCSSMTTVQAHAPDAPEPELLRVWQSDEKVRLVWRKQAHEMLQLMEEQGLKVRMYSQNKADKEIEGLQTVPAHKVYML